MGQRVSFSNGDGTTEGYLALPASGRGPGIVVIHEWWGLVGHIESITERFAGEGFVAFAPDLYHGAAPADSGEAERLRDSLDLDGAAKDLAGSARYVADRGESTGEVGAAGFCTGGSLAVWLATLSDEVTAAVAFYPVIPWERLNPKWERFEGKHAVIHCSEEDGGSAAASIQEARSAIGSVGGECGLHDYPGTRHAFFNDDRQEAYDPLASASAWARTLECFRTAL